MFAMRVLRYQHGKEDVDRFRVDSIKINGVLERNQGAQGAIAMLDAAVGYGNTMTYAGGAQSFPRDQPTKEFIGINRGNILSNGVGENFQRAFFANSLNAAQGAAGSEKFFNLHGINGGCAVFLCV